MLTTGEPWNPDPYMWLHEKVGGGRCPIINASGGTEVGACFLASPSVAMPIKACSLGFRALGHGHGRLGRRRAARSSAQARSASSSAASPFPGMTRGFWRDPERYLDTYWRRFPGVWTHGDWASVDEDGYWFLHGRSDDTLNIAGKRIGPAEIESAVVAHPAVSEAAAVGVPHEVKGEVIWVFCVRHARRRAARARTSCAGSVAAELGKAFTPERIVFVDGAAQDALREDRAPRRAGDGARAGPRRHVLGREPRGARGDRRAWSTGRFSSQES